MADGNGLKIEKNVPLPLVRTGVRADSIILALRALEVGDSVYLAGKRTRQVGPYFDAARRFDRTIKFCSRAEDTGCRVWRIA